MDDQCETPAGLAGGGEDVASKGKLAATSIIGRDGGDVNPPVDLTRLERWVAWEYRGEEPNRQKVPIDRRGRGIDATDPANWSTYEEACARAPDDGGVGIVLGDLDEGGRLGGVDLDGCRDPETGELAAWARELIDDFGCYAEVSPSGTGVKLFALGAMPKLPAHVIPMDGEPINGKAPQIEAYTGGRFFTVTGAKVSGAPAEVRVAKAWLRLHERLEKSPKATGEARSAAGRNDALYRRLCGLRAKGWSERAIRAAAEAENENPESELHASFADGPLDRRELDRIVAQVMKQPAGREVEFVTDQKGKIVANDQDNVRRALHRLGAAVSHDAFADRLLIRRGDEPARSLDDASLDRLWLEIDATFGFRPSKEFYRTVVTDHARANAFHPVRDYLDGLKWDGTPRLDTWLVDYGGAADSEYCRAVGALVLVAAVRRVRRPGVKFDEMLVLESPQGTNKSSALAALCPDPGWFTDDLPLNVGAKEVIERTAGRWIVEAGELSGMRKGDVEHLKGFLSRQTDVARLAYARVPTERPRHFIVVGTTNSTAYLKDATGNRRFWPRRVENFDLERLRRDRDQLWAEAAHREAAGASIRLDPALWPDAEVQQERRRVEDPWENRLAEVLGDLEGKLLADDAWTIVGMHDVARRESRHNERIGEAMRRLGFERRMLRFKGQRRYHYVRGSPDKRIEVRVEQDPETGYVRDVEAGYEDDLPM